LYCPPLLPKRDLRSHFGGVLCLVLIRI
jgi:hypothetical protein